MKTIRPAALGALLLVAACAGGPRPYDPLVDGAALEPGRLDSAMAACAEALAAEDGQGARDLQSGAAGAAAAYGTLGAGAPAAITGAVSGGALVAGAIVAAPVTSYVVSRNLRNRAERRQQDDMTACLAREGISVTGWRLREAAKESP